MDDYIYTLTSEVNGTHFSFYVGHTNDPARRLREHKSAARTGTEDKYTFIRTELEPAGLDWTLQVIRTIPAGETVEDFERWHVIDQIRQGNPIQNMKHGDARQQAELITDIGDYSIQSPTDVRRVREQRASDLLRQRALADEARLQREMAAQAAEKRLERRTRLRDESQARFVEAFVARVGEAACLAEWGRMPSYPEVLAYETRRSRERAAHWLTTTGVWRNNTLNR